MSNIPKDRLVFDDAYEMLDYLSNIVRHGLAEQHTATRLKDAHDYVQQYCLTEGWGRIVWHTILDDAIRMRKEQEKKSIESQNH